MPDTKKDAGGRELADEMFSFYRELSLSNVELKKAIRDLTRSIAGDGEEAPGLVDKLDALEESVGELDENVTEQNLLLHRYNHVADRIVETMKGDPAAAPPVQGRAPTLEDVANWLVEYDEMTRKEEEAAAERERIEAEAAAAEAALPPPPRMPMLTNAGAAAHELPPMPVMPE